MIIFEVLQRCTATVKIYPSMIGIPGQYLIQLDQDPDKRSGIMLPQ